VVTFQINDEECYHKQDRCIPVLSTEKEEEPQPGASAPLERLACQVKSKWELLHEELECALKKKNMTVDVRHSPGQTLFVTGEREPDSTEDMYYTFDIKPKLNFTLGFEYKLMD
jgi:hypothetical protein